MRARDIMTPNPSVVMPEDKIARVATLMRDRRLGMVPVIDNLRTRRLVGVVTDHDIVVRCVARQGDLDRPVSDLMTTEALSSIDVDATAEDVIALMHRTGLRRIPVLDERTRVVGVVSIVDISRRTRPFSLSGRGRVRASALERDKVKTV
jgi:CBS domain-containing protein